MCQLTDYIKSQQRQPLFIQGDSLEVLRTFPNDSVDCCVTSPPYWGKRQYENGGIGMESNYQDYIENLFAIISEVKRVLKPTGAFWLNIGDSYNNKNLMGIPWRVALKMIDDGWILRNDVIWYKHKGGMSSSKDRFGNVYEDFFFFVKSDSYYFDSDSVRANPRKTIVKNGAIISSTGVSGIRYKRQIELSSSLSDIEKNNALQQLELVLNRMKRGEISDFRMVIRNQQRATHSDETSVSGRAKELRDKGFYFMFYNANGTMPSDVWEILPEDTQNRKEHYAPYPQELCIYPLKATCPKDGIVLDPFSGTGTTAKVAYQLGLRSVNIDMSAEYNRMAQQRVAQQILDL